LLSLNDVWLFLPVWAHPWETSSCRYMAEQPFHKQNPSTAMRSISWCSPAPCYTGTIWAFVPSMKLYQRHLVEYQDAHRGWKREASGRAKASGVSRNLKLGSLTNPSTTKSEGQQPCQPRSLINSFRLNTSFRTSAAPGKFQILAASSNISGLCRISLISTATPHNGSFAPHRPACKCGRQKRKQIEALECHS
jgi:hypothetical protein